MDNTFTYQQDFRLHLQEELIRRCQKNNAYSLRSFAKSLKIHHAALSQILREKRPLTVKMIKRLSLELDLSSAEIESYLKFSNHQLDSSDKGAEIMSIDVFHLISDWYHFALLELLKINNLADNEKWLANTLSITVSEVNISIERLIRLKMLKVENGQLIEINQTEGYTNCLHQGFTNNAKKKYQKQTFSKAILSLENDDLKKRRHSGVTMAIDSSKLDGATKIISKFRRELMNFLEESENLDDVYHLSIGLFPLTKIQDKISNQIEGENL